MFSNFTMTPVPTDLPQLNAAVHGRKRKSSPKVDDGSSTVPMFLKVRGFELNESYLRTRRRKDFSVELQTSNM
jgi:hypothetical protein